jgi:hypothetical protein
MNLRVCFKKLLKHIVMQDGNVSLNRYGKVCESICMSESKNICNGLLFIKLRIILDVQVEQAGSVQSSNIPSVI